MEASSSSSGSSAPGGSARTGPSAVSAGSSLGGDAAGHDPFAERPELYVGAAFGGGVLAAVVLRLLAR